MQETIKDIATWIGVGANQWLKQSNILIRINAYLLALKELAKSFAISMGYVEKNEEKADDPLGDIEQGWDDINKQVDEYQGKLLGFDKFQVLTSADTGNGADIPAELLKTMQEYESILGKSQNVALFGDAEKNIKGAYDILKDLGFVYDEVSGQWLKDGKTVKEWVLEIAKTLGSVLFLAMAISKPFIALAGSIEYLYSTNEDFKKSVDDLMKKISIHAEELIPIIVSLVEKLLPIIANVFIYVLEIIEILSPIVADILEPLMSAITPIGKIIGDILHLIKNISSVISPIISMIAPILEILSPVLEIIRVIVWLVSTVLSGAIWFIARVLQIPLAILELILKIVQSIAKVISSLFNWDFASLGKDLSEIWTDWQTPKLADALNQYEATPKFLADGGLATKGSLFYAGEAGPELVTQTSGGGSTIMNMQQLEDAVARGMMRSTMATQSGEGQQITVNVSGRNLFSIFVDEARSNGYELVKVR
jgi:hypothetical protein